MNTFGLTFRSSKWSMHENINITTNFKDIFFKVLVSFLVSTLVVFLLLNFKTSNNFFFNLLSFFFWFTLDSFDYCFSFTIWSALSFISLSASKLYFFMNNYDYKFKNLKSNKEIFLSKNDLNWVMYSWLISSKNIYAHKNIEFIFDTNVTKGGWAESFNFFFNLYNLIFFLNLNDNNYFYYNVFYKNLVFKNFNFFYYFFENTNFLNNYFKLASSFYFQKPHFLYKNNFFFFNNASWSLSTSSLENLKLTYLMNFKTGYFFANNLHFFDLTNVTNSRNFFFIKNLLTNNNLNEYLNFAKWNRWLYRYSLLHRKSIKFNQKLTFTKRLLHSGFYNSSTFKKNIWNSVYFNSKNLNDSNLTTFFDSYFNDFFFKNKNVGFNKKLNKSFLFLNDYFSFSNFKFFEGSYFWSTKRFFTLNALDNNNSFFKFKVNFKLKNAPTDFQNVKSPCDLNSLYFNFFLKNRVLFLQPLVTCFNAEFEPLNSVFDKSIIANEDYYLFNSDLDLFSKNNLFLTNNISNSFLSTFDVKINFTEVIDFQTLRYNFLPKSTNYSPLLFINNILFTNNIFFYFKDLLLFNTYLK